MAAPTDDATTKATIKAVYESTGELLDPHSAVGVNVARRCHDDASIPLITLATAHPAKFPDAVESATGVHPTLPAHLSNLFSMPERVSKLENDIEAVKSFIAQHKAA